MTEDIIKDYGMIKDLIRDKVKRNPNKILMNIDGKDISYLLIENKINSIMFYLNEQNREINKVSIDYSDDFMVVLFDDGSTDGTKEWVEENYTNVNILSGDGTNWWTG